MDGVTIASAGVAAGSLVVALAAVVARRRAQAALRTAVAQLEGYLAGGELPVLAVYPAGEDGELLRSIDAVCTRFEIDRARLTTWAHQDPVTEAPNRRALERALADAVRDGLAHEAPAAIAVVDIDHFKRVNDEHGHETGDIVLEVVSDVLRRSLRGAALVGRWGGDELLVIADDSAEGLAIGLERARAQVPLAVASTVGRDLTVTISAGVAPFTTADDTRTWLRRADSALYDAKRAGRDRVEIGVGLNLS